MNLLGLAWAVWYLEPWEPVSPYSSYRIRLGMTEAQVEAVIGLPPGERRGQRIGGAGFAFSPDGKALAARGPDRAIHLWETATGKEVRKLAAGPEDASPLGFSRDGTVLATSADGVVRLGRWRPARGSPGCGARGAGRGASRLPGMYHGRAPGHARDKGPFRGRGRAALARAGPLPSGPADH
jgi:WD40 repeat protein